MFKSAILASMLLTLLIGSQTLAAPVPRTIGFMGLLKSSAGESVSGTVNVTLSVYDTATGGTALWSETQNVQAANGLFSTTLGAITPIPANLDFSQAYFVGVTPEGDSEMTPRIPLQGVPYALFAHSVAENSVAAPQLASDPSSLAKVSGGVMTSADGNIGIGTAAPKSMLSLVRQADRNAVISLDSGDTSPQYSAINFLDQGTPKWGLGKDPDNSFYVDRSGVGRMLTIEDAGNMGIGTGDPAAKLDVRGDIRLGTTGALYAASGSENLRIVRGEVTKEGIVTHGSGFTIEKTGQGTYFVDLPLDAFSEAPTGVFSVPISSRSVTADVRHDSDGYYFTLVTWDSFSGQLTDAPFSFILAGPR